MLCGAWSASSAQTATATSTTLTVTSDGTTVTTVSTGSVVTLTASVTAGTAPVTPGLVKFCDAAVAFCEDIHIVGNAQLTAAGTVSVKFRPGIGSHSYKAVFVGTNSYAPSASSSVPLTVTGLYPTSTTYSATGGLGSYNVTATVTGTGLYSPAQSGSVSFVDTSTSNAVLAQATLNSVSSVLTLQSPANPAIAQDESQIAVGDFNGDGIPDLAITTWATGAVLIWLGNGDGTFRPGNSYSTGPNPNAIAVADFNSDGNPDLAIANFNCGLGCTGTVTILLGNGDGTFTPTATSPATGSGPQGIAAGDFNGDGIPDLAVANFDGDSITVLLGNGDGTFTAAPVISFPFNTTPPFILAGDFNGDGKLDLATFSDGTNGVIVLLGKGDGTFPTTITTPTPNLQAEPSTAMADLNEDGIPDLVVTSFSGDATVLLGTGNGAFAIGATLGFYDLGLTVGDFNGDGIPDLAANYGYEVNYLMGVGDGTFTTGPTFDASKIANSAEFDFTTLISADLNGDGLSDVVGPGFEVYPSTHSGWLVPMISTPVTTSTGSTSITVGTGNHLVEASYPGDSNYGSSVSATTTLAGPAATTLGLALSSGPRVYGQPLALTATLSPYSASGDSTSGEPISFYNNSTLLGTADLSSGVATLSLSSLSAGNYSFSANYAGDGKFLTSNSSAIPGTVSQATPAITWPTPTATTYGTALGAAQLNANSPVAGTFGYSPEAGTVLGAGPHTITATLTPTDSTDYTAASSSVTLVVNQATPAITWPAPAAITYGTALGAAQLNASSPVAGTFTYSSAAGTVLGAGSHTITATFTPTDSTDYTGASSSITLVVNQATPAITWGTPVAITYGTALGAAQLNASSPLAGTFTYSPAVGTVLGAGSHSITATFTPTDSTDYTGAISSVTLVVNQATPAITWPTPAAIIYGTAIGAAQLDASSPVAGSLTYSPASGTLLGAGSQTLKATFTPADTADYTTATATVTLTVNQATPTIIWPAPVAITYGTALGGAQLDASSPVAGTFAYSPAASTVLDAGPQTLKATFTPTDTTDYAAATASVALTVNQATPAITWPTPTAISYGTALGAAQLDATSPVAGSFAYSPAAGAVLVAGSQTLKATFTPSDTTDYSTASATVTLTVNEATPTITWPTPAAIAYGAGLGSAQLDAASSVAGSFAYSPVSGTVLGAGPQTLTATFTPTDAADYTAATRTVTLTVNQATPTINWATPAAITAGTALTATQLDATASVPGTFVYNPAPGTTPPVGTDTLSVTFTPTDNVDYATVTATVTLTVNVPLNPVPFLGNITPAIADAGGAAFTITVKGSGFLANSTVYWGTTALTTQFVSSTQLTATVTSADIAIPGATAVNVQTPAPGGGTSDVLQFEVDSPAGSTTAPTVPSTVVTVTAGTTATYSISFPGSVTNATATCLNLPAGAICSYSFATGVLTISTSSTTPSGTYQVTVVFAETVASTSTAFILLPFLLLPLFFLRKKLAPRAIWPAVWLSLILLAATAFSVGCGGSSSPTKTTTTQSVTSSGVVGMTVQ
jgi:hypothetical protein